MLMQTQYAGAQATSTPPKPARGRQLVNQLKSVVGAAGPTDPMELLKLLDDPMVTEGFMKQSQALHCEERNGDRLDRSAQPRGSRQRFSPCGPRRVDPALMASVQRSLLACPLRA